MFPLIQTLSWKCYVAIFPMVVFVSLSLDEIVAAFHGGLRMKQMVPQRAKSLFLKGGRRYSASLLDVPAGERSRL